MTAYNLVVLTNAVEGREAEYNDWYDNQHLHDVLRIDGFTAARRFKIGEGFEGPQAYLAIYEMETDDPLKVIKDLTSRGGTPDLPISTAMDRSTASMTLFKAIGPRVTAKA